DILATRPDVFVLPALLDEADREVALDRTHVGAMCREPDPAQVLNREAVLHDQAHRLTAVTLAPVLAIADADAGLGRAVDPIHVEQPDVADKDTVCFDGEAEVLFVLRMLVEELGHHFES